MTQAATYDYDEDEEDDDDDDEAHCLCDTRHEACERTNQAENRDRLHLQMHITLPLAANSSTRVTVSSFRSMRLDERLLKQEEGCSSGRVETHLSMQASMIRSSALSILQSLFFSASASAAAAAADKRCEESEGSVISGELRNIIVDFHAGTHALSRFYCNSAGSHNSGLLSALE